MFRRFLSFTLREWSTGIACGLIIFLFILILAGCAHKISDMDITAGSVGGIYTCVLTLIARRRFS